MITDIEEDGLNHPLITEEESAQAKQRLSETLQKRKEYKNDTFESYKQIIDILETIGYLTLNDIVCQSVCNVDVSAYYLYMPNVTFRSFDRYNKSITVNVCVKLDPKPYNIDINIPIQKYGAVILSGDVLYNLIKISSLNNTKYGSFDNSPVQFIEYKITEKDMLVLMRQLYYDGYILPLFMDHDTCLGYIKMEYHKELYRIMLKVK